MVSYLNFIHFIQVIVIIFIYLLFSFLTLFHIIIYNLFFDWSKVCRGTISCRNSLLYISVFWLSVIYYNASLLGLGFWYLRVLVTRSFILIFYINIINVMYL